MVGIFSLGHWQQFQQIELILDLPSWQGAQKVTIHCQQLGRELFIYWEEVQIWMPMVNKSKLAKL